MSIRTCAWCAGPLAPGARRDAITCSKPCRQARHRAAQYVRLPADALPLWGSTRRFAYADPPYPGNSARLYGDHPDYAGEVDHGALLSRLATFDGWALSTSADALLDVGMIALELGLPVQVAAWYRYSTPHGTARYPVSAWEPVLYVPQPSRVAGAPRPDALAHGIAPMTTLPSRVVGLKPPAFCRWMFDLIGATPTDTLDDLFPGSGIVSRCWDLFTAGHDAAAAADDGCGHPNHGAEDHDCGPFEEVAG